MWDPLDKKLDDAHSMVKELAFGVVLFVAALILLALSSLFGRQHFLQNRFYILGCLVTAGATAFVILVLKWHWGLIWDLLTIMYYQRLLVIFLAPPCLLLVFLLWSTVNFGRQCWRWHKTRGKREDATYDSHDIEADSVKPEISFPPLRETADEFSRCTVLLIAITVFCSALCGLGYSYSASKAGHAAHETLKSLLDMEVRSSKSHTNNNDILLQLADFYEYRARLTVARQYIQYETSLPEGWLCRLNRKPGQE